MSDYSVDIQGYVEKYEAENAISVISLKFGIVISDSANALDASVAAMFM